MCRSASAIGIGSPSALDSPTTQAVSSSKSSLRDGPKIGCSRVGQLELALRTADRGAAHNDRARPAVVGDGHVQPVGQQRVLRIAEHRPDVCGMFLRGIEVGVTANRHRQLQARLGARQQGLGAQFRRVTELRMFCAQQLADARPRRGPCRTAERNEVVERCAIEYARACRRDPEQAALLQRGQVEYRLADCHPGARARVGRGGKDPVGKVVQRKMRIGGDVDKRARRGVRCGHQGLPVKCLARSLPAGEVVGLPLRRLQRKARWPDDIAALEHEGERRFDLVRGECSRARPLEGRRVGPVTAHAVVQARAARREAFRLGVVNTVDQAHEFAHHVAMEPGRAKGVLGDHPARRKDHEVKVGRSRRVGGRGQHGEDRRIGMIEAHAVDDVEAREIVFVRHVIAMPGDDIERRVIDGRAPQPAAEFGHQLEVSLAVLERRHGRQKIARIGEPVGADRPQLGQPQRRPVVLADVAARRGVEELHLEACAARDERDFPGAHVEQAEFRRQPQRTLLRDEQQLAIRIVEVAPLHRPVGRVEVNADPALQRHVAVAGHRDQAVDEVGRRPMAGAADPSATASAAAPR